MLSFKSASLTVESVELLTFTLKTRPKRTFTCENTDGLLTFPFAMETRNTVARESLVGLLGLLTMETRPKDTFTCENGLDLLDLLDMQGGRTASTHGGRGRTTAHGRERHGLLNMHSENLDSGKGLRGSGMGPLPRLFFTFKSNGHDGSEVCAWV